MEHSLCQHLEVLVGVRLRQRLHQFEFEGEFELDYFVEVERELVEVVEVLLDEVAGIGFVLLGLVQQLESLDWD